MSGADDVHDGDEPERLVCMRDNVEVSSEDPHCLYPTSQCRFREICPVMEAVRARRRKLNGTDAAPARSLAEEAEDTEARHESG